ncbi:hypothetical protein AWB71_05536 [Caballeronia peredens]|nr:hypothetical protein AWB71_05536 [Caballeronia peredens]
MRRNLLTILLIVLPWMPLHAHTLCEGGQHANLQLPKIKNGRVLAIACPAEGDSGTITLNVLAGGKKLTSAKTAFKASAYELLLDNSIDFDNGVSQGLGVSTGEGRDANGMHYWIISADGRSMIDLGDAPLLVKDKFMKGYFSTLVSSSGEYQAFRYFYVLSDNRLSLQRAIGYKWNDDSSGTAVSMEVLADQNFISLRQKTLPAAKIDQCQKGEIDCW